MRLGKPHVQREDTRFHAESDQEQHEQQNNITALGSETGNRIKGGRQSISRQYDEGDQQEQETDVHQQQVTQCGSAHLLTFRIEQNQHKRGERHHLPSEQEPESIP